MSGSSDGTRLVATLRALRRRARAAARWSRVLGAAAALPLALGGAMLADALWPMAGWARGAIGVALALAALRVPAALVAPRALRRAPLEADAQRAERSLELDGAPIVSGLQLRDRAEAPGIEGSLASRAVARAAELARHAPLPPVWRDRRLRRRAGALLVAALPLAALAAVNPSLIAHEWGRFATPLAPVPAWTATRFEIATAPDPVLVGDDVRLTATLRGPLPGALRLTPTGDASPIPMRALGDGRFETALRDLREPIAFRLAGETGESRVFRVDPIARPRVRAAWLRVEAPAYADRPPVAIDLLDPASERPAALLGSTLTLRVATSIDLADARTATGDATIDGRSARVSITPASPGPATLSLTPVSAAGLAADAPVRAEVRVVADAPPTADVLEPADAVAIVAPNAEVPLRVEATDDVRIDTMTLRWTLKRPAGEAMAPIDRGSIDLMAAVSPSDSVTLDPTLSIGGTGARAGDEVEVVVEAADNRPDALGGAQATESRTLRLRVASGASGGPSGDQGGGASTPAEADDAAGSRPGAVEDGEPADDAQDGGAAEGATSPSDGSETPGPASEGGAGSSDDGGFEQARDDAPAGEDDAPPASIAEDGSVLDVGSGEEVDPMAPPGAPSMRDVPPAYRDLVARYYRLLREAEDGG